MTVDEFLLPEDAAKAKLAFEQFRRALLSGDRRQVITQIKFAAVFMLNGYPIEFETANAFAPRYDKFFTEMVIDSVRNQKLAKLVAEWDGVRLANGAVSFRRDQSGEYRIVNVIPETDRLPHSDSSDRLICIPVVIEGRVVAYNWVSHSFPGFENIFVDHMIVDVTKVIRGEAKLGRIRVDFWGVSSSPQYNLSPQVFEPGHVWRMYLRPAGASPANEEVCGKEVQDSIRFVDQTTGKEVDSNSAWRVFSGDDPPSHATLPCFEVSSQLIAVQDESDAK